jgi:hypothetical protein
VALFGARVYTYSIGLASATWGTIDLLSEADPDAGIRITAQEPAWRPIYGVDGEVAHVRRSNFPATVQIGVTAHGATHRNLLSRLITDAQTGVVVAPFLLTDIMAGIGYSAPLARLAGLPEVGHGGTASVATWTLLCPMLVPIVSPGANNRAAR